MITYELNPDGTLAQKIVDGVQTGIWCSVETNQEYLDWVAAGGVPTPWGG
jgi:hypothetical protein